MIDLRHFNCPEQEYSYFYPLKTHDMEILTQIIILISGFAAGFFLALLLFRHRYGNHSQIRDLTSKNNELTIDNKLKAGEIENRDNELERIRIELDTSRHQVIDLSARLSEARTDLRNLGEKLDGQKKETEQIRDKFMLEFKALAGEIMQKESKTFTEQNKMQIESLLKPLGEKIRDFEKKVEETYDKETRQRVSLKEEVKRLSELNRQISTDAQNLADALKGQTKTQGSWGELILESILEKSGLEKDREFFVQKAFISENGRHMQPDVVLSLPGEKNVVIDAKVSLTAYEKYVSAETEEERRQALKNHMVSVKKHVDELSAKNYQHLYQINSLDFVIMFMPVEPAFLAAIKNDNALWSYSYEKGILLIGPTNLFATLKMISSIWQHEYQNRNVLEIARESGRLYDKFVGFVNDLSDIGNKLDAAQKSHQQAVNKLSTGRGNLVSRAEKIKSLGARTHKSLPGGLAENEET